MATASEIQARIKSIEGTMKITNAMYMISSAKVKKARSNLDNTLPYFNGMHNIIQRIVRHIPDLEHRYFGNVDEESDGKFTRGYVVITADKGLAGSYAHNIEQLTEDNLPPDKDHYRLYVLGEVGREYFHKKGYEIDENFKYAVQDPNFSRTRWIGSRIVELFNSSELDEVYVIYSQMKGITTDAVIEKLLPLEKTAFVSNPGMVMPADVHHEIIELFPSEAAILDQAVPAYVIGYLYGALVESFCSEQNARMTAMQSATQAATEILTDLKKKYNRVRQGAITQEITEVVSGARAIRRRKKKKEQQST